jgi:hypothetical protein
MSHVTCEMHDNFKNFQGIFNLISEIFSNKLSKYPNITEFFEI